MMVKQLKPQGIKILKMFHILFAFMWIIGGIALCLVLFLVFPETGDELYMRSLIIKIIDDFLIVPGATLVMLSGVIYGVWTNWGFFKHRWLAVKWIMTIIQILIGSFILGPRVNGNVEIANQLRDLAFADTVFLKNVNTIMIFGIGQTVCLLLYIVISIQKPWKKKNKTKKGLSLVQEFVPVDNEKRN
jgi:hypothetical protein